MASSRHLRRAPITEALIDIRVQLQDDSGTSQFEALRARLQPTYPTVAVIKAATFSVAVGKAMTPPTSNTLGLVFKDVDEKTQAQFRVNGFTFNRLAPYSSWETIFPETMRLWRQYVEIAQPLTVVRLATRYINRLKFPLPVEDLGKYLTAPPQIPPGLPQSMRSFLTRVLVVDQQARHSAILTQALETLPVDPGHFSVLLDVDAYRDVEYAPDDPRIETVLQELRSAKNDIFFSSLTETAAELYQ